MVYTFAFLTDRGGDAVRGRAGPLVPCGRRDATSRTPGRRSWPNSSERHLVGNARFNVLYRLYQAIREAPVINAYVEESQDPDKVLDIFVRVNSGGTQLSYSDLLLSMATNQWQDLDAREEVRSLVTELNDSSSAGFSFTKDIVLKSGLMLIDVPDIRFKVSNFTQQNMSTDGEAWPSIRSALLTSRRPRRRASATRAER